MCGDIPKDVTLNENNDLKTRGGCSACGGCSPKPITENVPVQETGKTEVFTESGQ